MSRDEPPTTSGPTVAPAPARPPDPATYAYLLGVHLGAGRVAVRLNGDAPVLRLSLSAAYPGIVEECASAVVVTSHGRSVDVRTPRTGDVRILESVWEQWPVALPQHAPTEDHRAALALQPWQRAIVDAHPGPLVRGLIHANGCRTVNRFRSTLPSGRVKKYAYPRYFFSNPHPDVRALFRHACSALGVRTTTPSARNVSVSHRASIAVLEEIVGPKA